MNRISILLIFCFSFIPLLLPAQPGKYLFSHVSVNDGLSHNRVTCITRDSKGFMWFGTMSGLNRYNGHSFKVFKHSLSNKNSISDNFVTSIQEDHTGKLWVQTRLSFNIYDPEKEEFSAQFPGYLKNLPIHLQNVQNIYIDRKKNIWILNNQSGPYCYLSHENRIIQLNSTEKKPSGIISNNISSIVQDNKGFYWCINKEGIIEKIDGKSFEVVFRNYSLKTEYKQEYQDYQMFADNENHLWIVMGSFPKGLFWYNTQNNTIRHVSRESSEFPLNTNYVGNISQDPSGIIWIATDQGGVNLFNKKSLKVRYLQNNPGDDKSISQNTISSLYCDSSGIMWVGTFKEGIDYYHENQFRFRHVRHESGNPNAIPADDIHCFAESKNGDIWIGTNGNGLLKYDRKANKYTQYKHIPGNPASLSNDIIVSLYIDRSDILWIGTYFGGLNSFDGSVFQTWRHNPADNSSLSDDRVWDIMEDSHGNFWIATLGGGLNQFDRKKGIFYRYQHGDNSWVHSNFLVQIEEDGSGNLWIGSSEGVDVLDVKKNKFRRITYDASDRNSLSNNNIVTIYASKKGRVFIGTHDGLNMYDGNRNLIKVFREEDGLPDNTILSVIEDSGNNFWIATPNNISNLVITGDDRNPYVIKNYDKTDGLQWKEFNERAVLKTRTGEILFGGALGFNIFRPDEIKENTKKPVVVISNLSIFNRLIKVNDTASGRVVLKKSLENTSELRLKYKENVFTIEFAALNYLHPEKNKFRYILEGFNSDWLTAAPGQHQATYTNIDPGDYTFRVIASNDDGYWNEEGATLKIHISPPWYRSVLAYIIYVLLLLGLLYLSRRMLLLRARMRFALEQERHEAQRMHEIDMMKIKFFTNVSHEFRTPLSLIITPVERLLKNTHDQEQKKQFTLIYRNARRLLNLVNQLLDLRKMEVQEFSLSPVQADIVAFVKDACNSFSDISENKNISLSFSSTVKEQLIAFDPDKMEKILFNLLSNAFKFTMQGGNVNVDMNLVTISEHSNSTLEIRVKDTGIGIPDDKKEKIFEQFFQNEIPGNMINQGSGIGLSITREFVKLHKGQIFVESAPGEGSCFIVQLPVTSEEMKDLISGKKETTLISAGNENIASGIVHNTKASVLLIEDNEDLRFYLKDNLRNKYHIIEASNGDEGLMLSKELIPDIIVSDITMPGMDGLDLCRKVKQERQTSHIPVILLTARTSEEQRLEGIKSGADDYITKPFNFEILESRIINLISQREKLRKSFQKHISVNASEIEITSLDEKLIQKALDVVEKAIANPDFSVEELSQSLGMSRVHLYKKLLAITGKTPIEFIRIVRLKRAAQLLMKSQLTVSEIAYEVGFNSPKYFARYFKEEFNVLPSQYAEKMKPENPD